MYEARFWPGARLFSEQIFIRNDTNKTYVIQNLRKEIEWSIEMFERKQKKKRIDLELSDTKIYQIARATLHAQPLKKNYSRGRSWSSAILRDWTG